MKELQVYTSVNTNEPTEAFAFETSTIAEGFSVPVQGKDYKQTILIKGAGTNGEITIKGGNGFRGSSQDLVIAVPANKYVGIAIDSAYYMQAEGENKGKYLMFPSVGTMEVAVVETR